MREKIFAYLRSIPKGKVVTYGQVAEYLGNKKLARVVGNILHQNPQPDRNPCFKVVNAQGKLSESFAFGGLEGQKARLQADGIEVVGGYVDLKKYRY